MEASEFRRQIRFASRCEPARRHILFTALHGIALSAYHAALRRIDAPAAVDVSSDGRSIAAVVAHIAAWDRWTLHAGRELAVGESHPGIADLEGFPLPDGETHRFDSVDAFNAFALRLQEGIPWAGVQAQALETSRAVHDLFTDPAALSPTRLSETPPWPLRPGERPEVNLPVGWYLWARAIDHEGFAHIVDLEQASEDLFAD